MSDPIYCDAKRGSQYRKTRYRLALSTIGLVTLALIATGCWDRREVNDLAIVSAVALDRGGPNSIELTLSLAVPGRITPPGSGGGGGEVPSETSRAIQGRTVLDATSLMQQKLSRRLFWAHNEIILIGEELAREGVIPIIDFFSRHNQPRLRTWVAIVPGKASDILATISPIEQTTPSALGKLISFRGGVAVTLRDFLAMLVSDGIEPIAPRIEIVHSGATEPGHLDPSLSSPLSQPDPPMSAVAGAAVFRGGQMIGTLDAITTRGVLWLRDELETATVTVALGEPGKYISFDLIRSTTKIEPRFEDGRIVMHVKITTEDDLNENAAGVDVGDPEVIDILQQEMANAIAVRVREAAQKVQREIGSDVFGFGDAVRRANPKMWNEIKGRWDEIFPTVELDIEIKAFIRRTGLTGAPLGVKQQGVIKAPQLRAMLARAQAGN